MFKFDRNSRREIRPRPEVYFPSTAESSALTCVPSIGEEPRGISMKNSGTRTTAPPAIGIRTAKDTTSNSSRFPRCVSISRRPGSRLGAASQSSPRSIDCTRFMPSLYPRTILRSPASGTANRGVDQHRCGAVFPRNPELTPPASQSNTSDIRSCSPEALHTPFWPDRTSESNLGGVPGRRGLPPIRAHRGSFPYPVPPRS